MSNNKKFFIRLTDGNDFTVTASEIRMSNDSKTLLVWDSTTLVALVPAEKFLAAVESTHLVE